MMAMTAGNTSFRGIPPGWLARMKRKGRAKTELIAHENKVSIGPNRNIAHVKRSFNSVGRVFNSVGHIFNSVGRIFNSVGHIFNSVGRVFNSVGRVCLLHPRSSSVNQSWSWTSPNCYQCLLTGVDYSCWSSSIVDVWSLRLLPLPTYECLSLSMILRSKSSAMERKSLLVFIN